MIESTGRSPARFLADPHNFLHAIDVDGDRAYFLRTDAQKLREASFVDGRNPITTTEPLATSLSEMIAAAPQGEGQTDRLLFNSSFCGSTQLARLLDVPGRSLVLKEPRCLTDIAAWKVFNTRDGLPSDRLNSVLNFTRTALRREFTPGETVSVKVASQGNALLDTLAEQPDTIRPVFITISRKNFLRAIFRGGVERMHYAAKIAWNLATDVSQGDSLLKEATAVSRDPLTRAANLAILAQSFQANAFKRAAKAGGWNADNVIDLEDITKSPLEAAAKAAKALNLDIGENDIERNLARLDGRYSKEPGKHFSKEQQREEDRRVDHEHARVFADALKWGRRRLGD
jgi:hypothetical protein